MSWLAGAHALILGEARDVRNARKGVCMVCWTRRIVCVRGVAISLALSVGSVRLIAGRQALWMLIIVNVSVLEIIKRTRRRGSARCALLIVKTAASLRKAHARVIV